MRLVLLPRLCRLSGVTLGGLTYRVQKRDRRRASLLIVAKVPEGQSAKVPQYLNSTAAALSVVLLSVTKINHGHIQLRVILVLSILHTAQQRMAV